MTEETVVKPRNASKFAKYEKRGERTIDGWLKVEAGVEFSGKLIGWLERENMNGDPVKHVLVEVDDVTPAMKKGNEEVLLEPGQVLGVPVNHSLRPILGYVAGQAKVYAFCTGKKPLEGRKGQSMYVWDLRVEPGAKPVAKLPPSLSSGRAHNYDPSSAPGDDEIPF